MINHLYGTSFVDVLQLKFKPISKNNYMTNWFRGHKLIHTPFQYM